MSIESNVSLIVATLDLRLVQDLRAAMNHGVDPGGPHVGPPAGYLLGPDPPQRPSSRALQSPAVRVVIRDIYVPARRCAGERQRNAVYDRWTSPPSSHGWLPASFPAQSSAPQAVLVAPYQPPWQPLPCPAPAQPQPVIKLILQPTDNYKGSVLDCFV